MNYAERNSLVTRIISGSLRCKVGGMLYTVKYPDRDARYEAQELYENILYEASFEEWLDEKFIGNFLIQNEFLSKDNEKNLKEIEGRIEELKVQLYQALFNAEKQKELKALLSRVKTKQSEMLATKHMFDSATPEGYASLVRDEFLLIKSIFRADQQLWPNTDLVNYRLLDDIVCCVNQSSLSVTDFRELARTEPWRSYWAIAKGGVFENAVVDWTEEQRTLAMFSRMYDNIYDSSEFPGDAVLDDDDMLDGWMILARKEREKQLNDTNVEKLLLKNAKHEGAGEVFIPVNSREEAEKINNMNDIQGRMIKKEREAQMKAMGGIQHGQLRDQKLELQQKAVEQYKQQVKGK